MNELAWQPREPGTLRPPASVYSGLRLLAVPVLHAALFGCDGVSCCFRHYVSELMVFLPMFKN